jgi:hypothetical protein
MVAKKIPPNCGKMGAKMEILDWFLVHERLGNLD